jgi:chitinase
VVVAAAGAATVVLAPPAASAATACATPWNQTTVYEKGMTASYLGTNYQAKWWNKAEDPSVNSSGAWAYLGPCGNAPESDVGPLCSTAPAWVSQQPYRKGDVVSYPGGTYYIAVNDNPGYNPTISGWYWDPYTCPPDFVVSQTRFRQMFPWPNPFYSYLDLVTAVASFPTFAKTGSDTVRKREAAAFLANVNIETAGLRHVVEGDSSRYANYCDPRQPYGCPAGQAAYYGRGPIQLSWNFNYKAAGDALGVGLLDSPHLLERDGTLAWKTAVWYWMTRRGVATRTPHDAMVSGAGFGHTIRAINGAVECDGKRPSQVQSRVDSYKKFTAILGVTPGSNLYC